MDFELLADDDPRRLKVRAWFDAHPHPTGMERAKASFVVPHWPEPWGSNAERTAAHRVIELVTIAKGAAA